MFLRLADWIVFDQLKRSPSDPWAQSLHFFIMDTSKIFFMLVLIIYLMGWFRSFVSPEQVRLYLKDRSRLTARILAVLLGAMTPFCSCSSVPLFIGFVEAGIPLGITFSFLIASPMINEIAVFMLWGIFGWQLTALYVLSGMIIAFLGGLWIEKFKPERWVEDYVWQIQLGQASIMAQKNDWHARHQYAINEVKNIVKRVAPWVVIGILIGALFHGYVPSNLIEKLSDSIWAVPMAVLIGIPLYSNAVGVIPLAEAMLIKGVSLGTVLSLMMSIAAISLPELMILKKVIRWPALILLITILALSIMGMGFLFNALF